MKTFKIKKIFNFPNLILCLKSERGVSLYFALLTMGILLAMSLTLSTLSILQLRAIRGIGDSVVAFYAANTGVEKAIHTANQGIRDGKDMSRIITDINNLCPERSPCSLTEAEYFMLALLSGEGGCPRYINYCIESFGIYRGVRRAIRVSK